MKFYVAKTSDRLFSIKKEGIEIEINTLEDLMKLQEKSGHQIIVDGNEIEIYDDYKKNEKTMENDNIFDNKSTLEIIEDMMSMSYELLNRLAKPGIENYALNLNLYDINASIGVLRDSVKQYNIK